MTRGIHWFRNDLRIHDNTALGSLAERCSEILPLFLLDPELLTSRTAPLPRERFLLDCVTRLRTALDERGLPLQILRGRPDQVIPRFMEKTGATVLSFNEDTTPFATRRDAAVARAANRAGHQVLRCVDRVVFKSADVRTGSGGAYSVYSPYRKAWWKRWSEATHAPVRTRRLPPAIPGFPASPLPALSEPAPGLRLPTGGEQAARRRLDRFLGTAVGRYHEDRDLPGIDGTSRLSPYLRFGAISVRECFRRALSAAEDDPGIRSGVAKWLDELVWRDFYAGILEESPRVLRENHRREYDALVWNDDPSGFDAWCEGRTGFPIVDAGMRQLAATGWMHNRVRMIVASFLTKDLLIHWRRGERFFFERLVDGDPASNCGGWQWAASTGTDAQPYFRIFNPVAQGKRWDPDGRYIRRWVPELAEKASAGSTPPWETGARGDYPDPILEHAQRRALALERFRKARAMSRRS